MTAQIRINLSSEQLEGLQAALADCGFKGEVQRVPADADVDPKKHGLATTMHCEPQLEERLRQFVWAYCRGFKDGVWACMDEVESLPSRLEAIGEVTLPGGDQIEYSAPQMAWETEESYRKRTQPQPEKPQIFPDPEPPKEA
jgi:hypothetical protein